MAAALAAGSLGPAQAAAPAPAAPSPWVKLSSCSRADHSAVFHSRMRRVTPGERMWMRFTLLERGADGWFAPVRAPGLGRWRKSKPGVRALGHRQRVRGLSGDSAYRARVEFRWYDRDGELVRRTRRRSRTCDQAGPQANLRARLVDASGTAVPGVTRYGVRVANVGAAAADDVALRLSVDDSAVDTRTVMRLEPGGSALVNFRGPDCESRVAAVADPGDTVGESSETDNEHRLACAQLPRR